MPIYEYACQHCGHVFEVLEKISDSGSKDCPKCNASHAKRLVSAPQFSLKGDGWYKTDYADKPKESSKKSSETKKTTDTKKTESSS